MNVLSFFDGMSCGQIALNQLGVKIENYFACEIDKYAIQVTQKNFPNTIQLGDVTLLEVHKLPPIDLFIGGSPCQGFSFAGKQLNFEDPRSKLFFEYAKTLGLLKAINPNIKFLLENVKMKKEYQDIITKYLGVEPVLINSSLVSAQNRERLYWSNIDFSLPEDRNINLSDITEDDSIVLGAAMRGRYKNNGKTQQFIEFRKDNKTNALTTVTKNALCVKVGDTEGLKGFDIIKRVYSTNGKCPTLTTSQGGYRWPKIAVNDVEWRALSPLECERAQTVPDNYTDCVSNSQRYKMLGNGWTVEVIKHIFKYFKNDKN